jgi:hypothetical protein
MSGEIGASHGLNRWEVTANQFIQSDLNSSSMAREYRDASVASTSLDRGWSAVAIRGMPAMLFGGKNG